MLDERAQAAPVQNFLVVKSVLQAIPDRVPTGKVLASVFRILDEECARKLSGCPDSRTQCGWCLANKALMTLVGGFCRVLCWNQAWAGALTRKVAKSLWSSSGPRMRVRNYGVWCPTSGSHGASMGLDHGTAHSGHKRWSTKTVIRHLATSFGLCHNVFLDPLALQLRNPLLAELKSLVVLARSEDDMENQTGSPASPEDAPLPPPPVVPQGDGQILQVVPAPQAHQVSLQLDPPDAPPACASEPAHLQGPPRRLERHLSVVSVASSTCSTDRLAKSTRAAQVPPPEPMPRFAGVAELLAMQLINTPVSVVGQRALRTGKKRKNKEHKAPKENKASKEGKRTRSKKACSAKESASATLAASSPGSSSLPQGAAATPVAPQAATAAPELIPLLGGATPSSGLPVVPHVSTNNGLNTGETAEPELSAEPGCHTDPMVSLATELNLPPLESGTLFPTPAIPVASREAPGKSKRFKRTAADSPCEVLTTLWSDSPLAANVWVINLDVKHMATVLSLPLAALPDGWPGKHSYTLKRTPGCCGRISVLPGPQFCMKHTSFLSCTHMLFLSWKHDHGNRLNKKAFYIKPVKRAVADKTAYRVDSSSGALVTWGCRTTVEAAWADALTLAAWD